MNNALESEEEPPDQFGLPRGIIILLGLASVVVVVFGMREVADILAPIFLALALTITVYPLRVWLQRLGVPSWLATLLVVIGVYLLLVVLVFAFVLGVTRLAELLPDYATQFSNTLDDITTWVGRFGVGSEEIQEVLANVDYGSLIGIVGDVVNGLLGVLSDLIFIIALLLFMGIDSAKFTTRMERVRGSREQAITALGAFATGTRKYFAVSTIFGAIVAVFDWFALVILDVPAALLWAILAFITNYIPNIGFIIGLVPPALLALLAHGPGTMIAVIIIYILLNFIIQSVIQPKYMGDSVGLTTTVTFLSLIFWTFVLGPLGSILSVPMTLLVKATLVDFDPRSQWLQLFLGDPPDHAARGRRRRGGVGRVVVLRRRRPSAGDEPDVDTAEPDTAKRSET
ncbi:MAG: AI-2E family transporter [Cumulibacter sp.]